MSNKKPLFFRDEGEMGDVLGQAKALCSRIESISSEVEVQCQNLEDFREKLIDNISQEAERELSGQSAEKSTEILEAFEEEWAQNKSCLAEKEAELNAQQLAVQSQKQELEERQFNIEGKDGTDKLEQNLQQLTELSTQIEEKLKKIESTKEMIDSIFVEKGREIKENILPLDEIEFLYSNYFNLIKSRVHEGGILDPNTEENYSWKDLSLEEKSNFWGVKVKKGIFKNKVTFRMDVRYLVPESDDEFYFRKTESNDGGLITEFISSNDFESFSALVLVSPSGWAEQPVQRVKAFSSRNQLIVLVDLQARVLNCSFNEKAKHIADLFVPVSIEESVQDLVGKLSEEILAGTVQFRIDKVSKKYQVPRKVVLNAFRKLEKSGEGEVIDQHEGAKDLIFLSRCL